MKLATIVIAAALVAGCKVDEEQRSFVLGTKLIEATIPDVATGCVYDPATAENVFGIFDPAFGYQHAVVVLNQLPDNSGLGPGRINTNDFQIKGATVRTEVLVSSASVADQVVPANGMVRIGQSLAVAIPLAQRGSTIPDGTDVRFHIQFFGNLTDGTSVKTNFYVYAAHAQAGFVAGASCPTGQAPVFCETDVTGVPHQDTGFLCVATGP